jgi:hypothetical protein
MTNRIEMGFIISTFKINKSAALAADGEIAVVQRRLRELPFNRGNCPVESSSGRRSGKWNADCKFS